MILLASKLNITNKERIKSIQKFIFFLKRHNVYESYFNNLSNFKTEQFIIHLFQQRNQTDWISSAFNWDSDTNVHWSKLNMIWWVVWQGLSLNGYRNSGFTNCRTDSFDEEKENLIKKYYYERKTKI